MVVNLIDILFTSLHNYSEALCDVYKVLSLYVRTKASLNHIIVGVLK